jgi:hypothetical protein
MIFKSRVGNDGVLHVLLPLGASEANHDVQVTVESTAAPTMTHDEWREWVEGMAGRIADTSFCRPEQGEFEDRKALN